MWYYVYPQALDPEWVESEEPVQYYLNYPDRYKLVGTIGNIYIFAHYSVSTLFFMYQDEE